MGRFDFNPDILGVLVRSPAMAAMLKAKAEVCAAEARRIAPVGLYRGGGRYRDSIEAEVGIEDDGLVGRVNAHHFTAWWIEAGTVRMAPFSPLRKALESGTVRDTRR